MSDPSIRAVAGRRFFPLYGKILLWFFAHVLLFGGVVFWLVREQFGLDRTLLLTHDGRARLQVRAEQTADALAAADPSRDGGDEIMARLSEEEQMHFALFEFGGSQVAGEPLVLPPPVRERLGTGRIRGGPPGSPGGGPPSVANEAGMRRLGPPPVGPPEENDPPRLQGETRRRDRSGPAGARAGRAWRDGGRPADFPKDAVRTENPTRYWVVVRLPPAADGPDGTGRLRPLALVGMAQSLGQSPLLFDPKPWLFGGLGLLTASALLWWPFVRGLTRALAQMRGATERIARGDFAVRVDDRRGDELGKLGEGINAMTGRLDGLLRGQKRFLSDIAHELCSPLSRMELGLGILEQRTPPDQRERLADVREEVREMSSLVHELLAFSRDGLQGAPVVREHVALGPLVEAAVAREAGEAEVTVAVPDGLEVLAAPSLLSRAVSNVLRNAMHHAGRSGPIEITASQLPAPPGDPSAGKVLLTIADHGPGVPAEALPKLFDPFFRVDAARARETGGVGLGLAIVKNCVDACGGTVRARAQPDGEHGLVVELELASAP